MFRLDRTIWIAAALLLTAAACSDDDNDADDVTPESGDDGASKPLYLIATAFFTADNAESYLVPSATFDAKTRIDPTSGVKLLGEIVPTVYGGSVFVTDDASPSSIKRYDLRGDKLVLETEVSFAGVGVTSIPSWFVYFVSSTKAYVFDQAGSRIIVWNPKTMELTGTQIELSDLDRDGWKPRLALEVFSPRRRGNEVLIPTAWTGQDEQYRFGSGLLVLDVEKDEVVSFSEDDRCGEAYMSLEDPKGDLYFFPSAFSSEQHYFADEKQPTCVLRVKKGERKFDPDYALNLSELTTGSAAIGAVPDGASGFYFAGADEKLRRESEDNGGAFWKVFHYDFATETSEPVDLPDWTGALYYVDVGGDFYLPYYREGASGPKTTVYSIGDGKEPEELFSFDASWIGFAKLR